MTCPRCQSENQEGTRFCSHCGLELAETGGQALSATRTIKTSARGLERGSTFAGRFEIIEEIGRGGMGTVYKAFDTKIKEVVALKLLKPEIAADPEIIDRFKNEIKLARKVSHRHVCRMYDLSEEGQTFYISMEFVAGEDLKSFIRRSGHLTELKTLDLARQIAEGLGEAHRLGVVHRDLKPQNIMIDREGEAKIMDFGIARSLHTRGLTGTGVIIGTPEYMSPEQADARDVDERADIYSFGAILYEMVTGRVPFDGETPLSIVLKHKTTPAPDPRDFNAQVSPGLREIILRCLEKRKDSRYQKMRDILEDIDRIGKGLPTAIRPAAGKKLLTSREITVKFRLRKIFIPAAALAVLLIASALIVFNSLASKTSSGKAGDPTVSLPAVPPPPPSKESGPSEEFPGMRVKRSPFLNSDLEAFYKGASRHLTVAEAKKLQETIDAIKDKADSDSVLSAIWGVVQNQIKEVRVKEDSGNDREAQKSYAKSVSEMQRVLTLVNEKERADLAKRDMENSKKRAEAVLRSKGQNLLSWIARIKEKDALEAYEKEDFSGARILYDILRKVYILSISGGDEGQCLTALQGLVSTVKAEADSARAQEKEPWLYEMATEEEGRARKGFEANQYSESASLFIVSAFLYEKARDVALEGNQPGQRVSR